MSEQIIVGGINESLITGLGNLRYNRIAGGMAWTSVEIRTHAVIPTAGYFKNFRIVLSAAPGVGKSWTFMLRKNIGNTTITFTISGTSTTMADVINKVRCAPGDTICFKVTCDTNANPTVYVYWSIVFVPDNLRENIILGGAGTASAAAVNYLAMANGGTWGGAGLYGMAPIKGVLKKLYVIINVAPGLAASGKSWTFGTRSDDTPSAISALVFETATTGNDTANTSAVVQLNRLDFTCTPSVAAPDAFLYFNYGIVYELEEEGYSVVMGNATNTLTVTTYFPITSATSNATENLVYRGVQPCRLSNFCVRNNRAPGVGESWTYTIRKNGTDTTLVSVVLSGAARQGADNLNFVNCAMDDAVNGVATPSAAALSAYINTGLVLYVDPTRTLINNLGLGHGSRIPHADNGIGLKRHPRSRAH
jgi:hypothetical protein